MSLFLTRRADLAFDAFADHWRDVHWPRIRDETGATAVAIRYVQNHRVDGVPPGVAEAPFDGVVEAWWPDRDTMYAVLGSPAWAGILRDEENFLDRAKTQMLLTQEKVDWRAPVAPVAPA